MSAALLAVDWGLKKIGLATADAARILVSPQKVYVRKKNVRPWKPDADEVKHLRELIEAYDVGAVVLGLPLNANGTESSSSTQTRDLAKLLQESLGLPVHLTSEVLTSWAHRGQAGGLDDSLAAVTILQDFIDNENRTPT